ncbi:hypothetical protein HDE_05308 [Halotydeus destructor]|nr:hypothetical protein HDE_05308 [Halotydeus destructor]
MWYNSSDAPRWLERATPIAFDVDSPTVYLWLMVQWYSALSVMVGIILYLTVQYTFLKYADHVLTLGRAALKKTETATITGNDLKNLRRMYCLFNTERDITNQKLGTLPFIWLGSLFVALTAGITDTVLHPYLYESTFTTMAMTVATGRNILLVFAWIYVSGLATDKLEQVKTILVQIAQAIPAEDGSSSLEKERRSLLVDIMTQPVVPAIAWGMFPINKQLILQFAGSVIPFSVMMITTAIQQKQANCPSPAAISLPAAELL